MGTIPISIYNSISIGVSSQNTVWRLLLTAVTFRETDEHIRSKNDGVWKIQVHF